MDQRALQPDLPSGQPHGAAKANPSRELKLPTRTLLLIGALALITGLVYFIHFKVTYDPDSPTYISPARNVVSGRGFVDADGYPEAIRTPGYPLLIMPFLWAGLDLKYLVVFQHLLRVALILAVSAFTFSLTCSRRQAIFAGVLLCIDLPMLAAANSVMTEMLFTAVVGFALWLLWRDSNPHERPWGYSLLYGVVWGASVLIRPVTLFFFIPGAAYLLLSRSSRRWPAAFSFIAGFAILPVLWAARNYHETGFFTVSSISGNNLLFYRAAGALALEQPGDYNANLGEQMQELRVQACADLQATYKRDCTKVPAVVAHQYYSRLGLAILKKHPLAYMRLVVRGAARMMLDGGSQILTAMTGLNTRAGVRLLLVYTVPAFGFAIAGLMRWWKEERRLFYLAFLAVVYFVVISAGAEAFSRLRVPIVPVYAVLIASGIDWTLAFFSKGRGSSLEA